MKAGREKFQGVDLSLIGNLPPGASVLDYGCGQGELTAYLLERGFRVLAADVDGSLEESVRKRIPAGGDGNFSFSTIRTVDSPIPDPVGPFDLIVLREVLEHVEEPGRVLKWLNGVLALRGTLVVSVPTAFTERYFSRWDGNWLAKSRHVNVFDRADVLALLRKASFGTFAEEGQSFRWSLFWFLLAPFRVNHVMGNPTSHPGAVRIAAGVVKAVCAVPGAERIGNRLFPKSRFFYAKRRKPRILVVYDYPNWILGKWASQIRTLFSGEYDIVTMSMFHAYRERKYAGRLLDRTDALHLLLPHCFPFFRELSPAKPTIATIHHWVEWGEMYSAPAFLSRLIVTGAGEWKEKLVEKGVPADRITVVHSGIEERFFEGVAPLLPESGKISIGFFAKCDSNESDRKGTRHFKNLLGRIAEAGKQDLFRVVLAGPGWHSYVEEIRKVGLEVVYADRAKDEEMPALYRSLDVYLMLSDVEGGPVTLAEAMASQCLVFTTNIGVAKDIVTDGENGILVDNADAEGIYGKLIRYGKKGEERDRVCRNAREYARSRMLFRDTFRPLGDVYRRILESVTEYGAEPLDVEAVNRANDGVSGGLTA